MKCAICRDVLHPTEEKTQCEGCSAAFHLECWTDNGGCATTGCSRLPKYETQASVSETLPETYWGATTKTCPACAETIDVTATTCPICDEHFGTKVSLTTNQYRVGLSMARAPSELTRGALMLFVCGMLGITAPFVLVIGGKWYQANMVALRDASPLHYVLATCGLVISALYCVIIGFALV